MVLDGRIHCAGAGNVRPGASEGIRQQLNHFPTIGGKATGSMARHAAHILINRSVISRRIPVAIDLRHMLKPGLSQILPRRTFVFLLCLALTVEFTARAQPLSWSQRAGNAAMAHWPAGSSNHAFGAFGPVLNGMGMLWYSTADGTYYSYEQQQVAAFLAAKGSIDPRSSMTMARAVLLVGLVTQDARYFQAAAVLDQGLSSELQKSIPRDDPRDIYDSAPFYAQYAQSLQKQVDFKKIAQRFAEDERGKGIPAGEIAG
jgi:hypothetical protein